MADGGLGSPTNPADLHVYRKELYEFEGMTPAGVKCPFHAISAINMRYLRYRFYNKRGSREPFFSERTVPFEPHLSPTN